MAGSASGQDEESCVLIGYPVGIARFVLAKEKLLKVSLHSTLALQNGII